MFGTAAGLIAAFGAAVDIVLITQSVRFLSEILFTPAVIVLAISFTHALSSPSSRRFGWVGFWIGVANLIRPTLVAFPLVAALVIGVAYPSRRGAVWMGVVTVVSCLVVLPWMVHNYIRHGAVYPLATSNAILWQGSPEYYQLVIFNYRALRQWGMSRSTTAHYMLWRAFPLVGFAALLVLRGSYWRLAVILSILAYCTLLHAVTHAEVRLSEPLHPLLLVIVAGAALRGGKAKDPGRNKVAKSWASRRPPGKARGARIPGVC